MFFLLTFKITVLFCEVHNHISKIIITNIMNDCYVILNSVMELNRNCYHPYQHKMSQVFVIVKQNSRIRCILGFRDKQIIDMQSTNMQKCDKSGPPHRQY